VNSDLFLVFGLVLAGLAFPSLINAFSESRAPKAAFFLFAVSGVMIAIAIFQKPSGYSFQDIPAAFVRVFSMMVN